MTTNTNVQSLDTNTIEFTNNGAAVDTPSEENTVTRNHDLGGSLYSKELERNELFETSGDAIAAFKAWHTSDKYSLVWIDRAFKEALVKYGMHKEANKANASPLTHAIKAMEHRGKKNLASKGIAFVQAVTNYKWDTKKEVFRLKKDKQVNTSFTPEQQAIYDKPFYTYVKPTTKKDWEFKAALKAFLAKAAREEVDAITRQQAIDEIAALAALELKNEQERKAQGEAVIRNDLKPILAKLDTQANDKDAA